METSRFSAGSTKRIFNNFYAMTSPKSDANGTQSSQVFHLNVRNSVQQVQRSITTNSVTLAQSNQTSTKTVDFKAEKKAQSFSLLKIEIDAMVKDKAASKLTLKEKERIITELNKTVTNQRKTISDLQLDNESLSHKFQDELDKRQEVAESMGNLWSLVEALKNNSDVLKQRFVKFEDLETELTDFANCCSKEVEKLENKFVHVNLAYEDNCNQFRDRISVECQQRETAEVRYKLESEQYEGEIFKLTSEIDKKHKQLEEVNKTIEGLNKKITEKMKEKNDFEAEMEKKFAGMNKMVDDLKFKNEDLATNVANLIEEKHKTQMKNQLELDELNVKMHIDKASILDLEEKLQEKENQLRENEIRFSELENQITEAETRMEEEAVKIATLLNEQTCLEGEVIALKENRSDMESVILKLKDTIDEKQRCIDSSKLELNESRANFAYAHEAKDDLETQIKSLTEENVNLKKSSAYFENLWTGIKFDMKLQEQKLTMTLNSLDEEIRKHKEDYAKLQKEFEAVEIQTRNQSLIDCKAIKDLKVLTKKQEDEIILLKEKNVAQAAEIELLQKNPAPTKTKKSATNPRNTNVLTKPRTRSAGARMSLTSTTPKARSTFTPTDDTDDSDLLSLKCQPVVRQSARKRVTFSPVISSHSLSADNKFDKFAATPPPSKKKSVSALSETNLNAKKHETCYGTPRRKVTEVKIPTLTKPVADQQQSSPAIRWNNGIDTDDVFKFSSD